MEHFHLLHIVPLHTVLVSILLCLSPGDRCSDFCELDLLVVERNRNENIQYTLLRLPLFTQHHVSEINLCCCVYQLAIPLCCSVGAPHCIHPFAC